MKVEALQVYNDTVLGRPTIIGEQFEVENKRGNLLVSRGYAKLAPTTEEYSTVRSRSRRESYGMETENN